MATGTLAGAATAKIGSRRSRNCGADMERAGGFANIHDVRNGSFVDDFKFKYPGSSSVSGGIQLQLPFG